MVRKIKIIVDDKNPDILRIVDFDNPNETLKTLYDVKSYHFFDKCIAVTQAPKTPNPEMTTVGFMDFCTPNRNMEQIATGYNKIIPFKDNNDLILLISEPVDKSNGNTTKVYRIKNNQTTEVVEDHDYIKMSSKVPSKAGLDVIQGDISKKDGIHFLDIGNVVFFYSVKINDNNDLVLEIQIQKKDCPEIERFEVPIECKEAILAPFFDVASKNNGIVVNLVQVLKDQDDVILKKNVLIFDENSQYQKKDEQKMKVCKIDLLNYDGLFFNYDKKKCDYQINMKKLDGVAPEVLVDGVNNLILKMRSVGQENELKENLKDLEEDILISEDISISEDVSISEDCSTDEEEGYWASEDFSTDEEDFLNEEIWEDIPGTNIKIKKSTSKNSPYMVLYLFDVKKGEIIKKIDEVKDYAIFNNRLLVILSEAPEGCEEKKDSEGRVGVQKHGSVVLFLFGKGIFVKDVYQDPEETYSKIAVLGGNDLCIKDQYAHDRKESYTVFALILDKKDDEKDKKNKIVGFFKVNHEDMVDCDNGQHKLNIVVNQKECEFDLKNREKDIPLFIIDDNVQFFISENETGMIAVTEGYRDKDSQHRVSLYTKFPDSKKSKRDQIKIGTVLYPVLFLEKESTFDSKKFYFIEAKLSTKSPNKNNLYVSELEIPREGDLERGDQITQIKLLDLSHKKKSKVPAPNPKKDEKASENSDSNSKKDEKAFENSDLGFKKDEKSSESLESNSKKTKKKKKSSKKRKLDLKKNRELNESMGFVFKRSKKDSKKQKLDSKKEEMVSESLSLDLKKEEEKFFENTDFNTNKEEVSEIPNPDLKKEEVSEASNLNSKKDEKSPENLKSNSKKTKKIKKTKKTKKKKEGSKKQKLNPKKEEKVSEIPNPDLKKDEKSPENLKSNSKKTKKTKKKKKNSKKQKLDLKKDEKTSGKLNSIKWILGKIKEFGFNFLNLNNNNKALGENGFNRNKKKRKEKPESKKKEEMVEKIDHNKDKRKDGEFDIKEKKLNGKACFQKIRRLASKIIRIKEVEDDAHNKDKKKNKKPNPKNKKEITMNDNSNKRGKKENKKKKVVKKPNPKEKKMDANWFNADNYIFTNLPRGVFGVKKNPTPRELGETVEGLKFKYRDGVDVDCVNEKGYPIKTFKSFDSAFYEKADLFDNKNERSLHKLPLVSQNLESDLESDPKKPESKLDRVYSDQLFFGVRENKLPNPLKIFIP